MRSEEHPLSRWFRGLPALTTEVRPPRWNELLRGMGIDEAQVLQLIECGGTEEAVIRRFVAQRRFVAYVPEAVLVRLGLYVDEDQVLGRRGKTCEA